MSVLAKCALAQVRCFNKWKNSDCIISILVNNVSKTRKWSWDKESNLLNDKLNKISSSKKAIMDFYWDRDMNSEKSVKAKLYKENNFEKSRNYLKLNLEYPEYSRGFRWLLRARCGYKIDSSVAKASKMINESCPNCCPCYFNVNSKQRIDHWFTTCFLFKEFRSKYFFDLDNFLLLLNNLFVNLHLSRENNSSNNNVTTSIVEGNSLNFNNENRINSNVNNYERSRIVNWYPIYIFFIGGRDSCFINNANNCPNKREWDNLYKCQINKGVYTDIPFLLRSVALLNDIMPIACKRQQILFNKFKTNLSNRVDAENTVGLPSRENADPSGIG